MHIGTTLTAMRDLLGVGDAGIVEACAELGCGSLEGAVPRLSKRGGLICHRDTLVQTQIGHVTETNEMDSAAIAVLHRDWVLQSYLCQNLSSSPGRMARLA